ncbi:MAG: tryptophan synthase subunit alpha [Deltaproteobacteria bacterium]|nr:tryptophan synthase subunit alpha [Deltaproteobacteria bacterium]
MKKKQLKPSGIAAAFSKAKKEGKKVFVPFVTAGDPDINVTLKIVLALERAGADIIELGVPFSDPMADGPTIQASSERALKKGVTIDTVFSLVRSIRKKTSIPVVLFGYYNPVFSYGLSRFAERAKKAGADGVLIVDMPPEESKELRTELTKQKLDLIYLLTPTSDISRIKTVTKNATGFIYYVSVAGVTGARKSVASALAPAVRRVKKHTKLPVAVGFGISTPAQAREVSKVADGVVVGSAIINVIAKSKANVADKKVEGFARSLTRAMR